MSEETKQLAHQLFPNPQIAARVVDALTSKRPPGWSHRSNATYYKKVYADEIYPLVKQMMSDGEDILYAYADFCTPDTGISKQSLYNRVNQSILYLKHHLKGEELEAFIQWDERTENHREPNVGIRINYIQGLGPVGGDSKPQPRPKSVSSALSTPAWMRRLNEWLEDNDNYNPFIKENLALSQSEIVDLKVRVSQLGNVQSSIESTHVRLIRLGE